jgi:hypothetical protein
VNTQYGKGLEKFANNESLSTFYQSTTDSDTYMTNKNSLNGKNIIYSDELTSLKNKKVGWDGVWEDIGDHPSIYAHFIQNNDKLIISITDSNIGSGQFSWQAFMNMMTPRDINECSSNTFVAIAQLNKERTIFNIIHVLCDTYTESQLNLPFTPPQPNGSVSGSNYSSGSYSNMATYQYLFSGFLQNGAITLVNNQNSTSITLQKVTNLQYDTNDMKSSSYLNKTQSMINENPRIYNSYVESEATYCPQGTQLCITNNLGLDTSSVNACGIVQQGSNICSGTPNCLFYKSPNSPLSNGIPDCANPKPNNNYGYMNFMANYGLTKNDGGTLRLCNNLIKNFNNNQLNACILCYITNLGDVKTLNYQFMNTLPQENSLTVQYDYMKDFLNKDNGILSYYRSILHSNRVGSTIDQINGISFTNLFENNTIEHLTNTGNKITFQNQLSNALNNYLSHSKYDHVASNKNLEPALWSLNYNTSDKSDLTNACYFTLSTSPLYQDGPVKYAQVSDDGTTHLSPYSGGIQQKFVFTNETIIKENMNGTSSNFIMMTANIITDNHLYLQPTNVNSFFNNKNTVHSRGHNSSIVGLSSSPEINGKWLVLGFNVNNIANLNQTISNIKL